MGQYFKGIILNKKGTTPVAVAVSYTTGNGAKLMEHSYIGNDFVGTIERLIMNNPQRVVWGGDYADNENSKNFDVSTLREVAKEFDVTLDKIKKEGINLYTLSEVVGSKIIPNEDITGDNVYNHKFKDVPKRFKYIVNHDKKEFVDKTKLVNNDGWRIHPLPILTCEGNGRGGGDFRGESPLIGYWSRDTISIESKKTDIPKDYKEVLFMLTED